MLKAFTSVRKTAVLLFLGLSFCYMSLAPATVGGRGYASEELESGTRMLEIFNAWVKGRHIPPMLWSRHGPIPVLFDLPFIKIGKFFVTPDFILSLEPSLSTAALVTILFLWLRKLCSPGMSLFLSLSAAFGTMLWPYTYIGLETKQSVAIMLAGYLALANGKVRGWPRIILLSVVCGLALTMKSTGIVLWPAFAYLLFVQFRDDWRSRVPQIAASVAIVVSIAAFGSWSQGFFWGPSGGGLKALLPWMISSPFQVFTNTIGMFGSPTKGLLIYAPILVVSLFSLTRAFRQHRDIAVWAALVTICMTGFMSLMKFGADEVWGSRYMHLAIAPLILCIGAAWPKFQWRIHAPTVLLVIVGVIVSFLGAFFYYGTGAFAMAAAGQNTMEWINGDNTWNEVTINARLFHTWLEASETPVPFNSAHLWAWEPPPGAPPWATIDLRTYSNPQSALINIRSGAGVWNVQNRDIPTIYRLFEFAFIAGPLLLLWVVVRTAKERSPSKL